MPTGFYFRFVVSVFTAILFVAIVYAWRADRRDRAQLAAELALTKQLLVAADAHQHDRDAQLAQTLATLAAEKRSVVSPAQIIRELPMNLALPAPITLQSSQGTSVGAPSSASPTNAAPRNPPTLASPAPDRGKASAVPGPAAQPSGDKPAPDGAFIPRADLKPLYDFTLDCQACQAKLSAAQSDLTDEKSKTAALTKERNDALRIAKGGSVWRRVTRAAKWFLLGAAAGAAVAKTR